MKKKALLVSSTIILTTALIAISFVRIGSVVSFGDNSPYTLNLNSNQKITTNDTFGFNEISGNVTTTMNNQITLSGYNIINNNNGWQTLLPGGYIYNPVLSTGTNNKISGIKSIKYIGNDSLELHYGYSLNNEQIIYSFEETLTAGIEYTFDEHTPSYFYIKNNNENNVSIDNLIIKYSCDAEEYPLSHLKVLMIGNSFADDTVYYAQRVAASYGIDLEIYDAYIAGCTINQHYENIQSGATSYRMGSMNGEKWNYQSNMSLSDIVTSNTWDIITFQQASAEIGRTGTYSNLANLVQRVSNIVSGNPKYYWHQTWAYDNDYADYNDYFSYFSNNQEAMFSAIVDRYNNDVVPLNIFEKTIFNGTAVQNVRSSYMGDTFTRDGKHMSSVHGRYLLTCNFISTVFDIDLDLSPATYRPDGISNTYQEVVREAVKNAQKYPNITTKSQYLSQEMDNYDLSNYTEIDAGLVGCSYYNSMDSEKYFQRIQNHSGVSNVYTTTMKFTRDTLPVGSLVVIPESFGYRPEAWANEGIQSERPSEQYNKVLEITEDFWSGYQYRAFNIFKCGKTPLSEQYVNEQYDEIFDGFHIFVPNSQMGYLQPKSNNPYYSNDQYLFSNHDLNIDDYERLHLDPIIGFYKCDELYSLFNKYVDDTAQRFVCTRPFYTSKGELPAGTVIIVDNGYRWRSDCWRENATYSPRPDNVTTNFTILDNSFMSSFRMRTFNVSKTNSGYVYQNATDFINHFRIYLEK